MNNPEQHIFFHLLRTALWQREPDATPFQSEDWQWRNILIALDNHALLALAADAIMTINDMLPSAKQLNPMQSMNLMQHCASVAQTHYDLNAAVIKSFAQLQQAGCTPILLKGQGLATLYPIKNTRSCGDLDIYVGRTDYEKAKFLFNAQCTPEEIAAVDEDCHQYHIKHAGITYELHPIAGLSAVASKQKTYERWSENYLKLENCETVNIVTTDSGISTNVNSTAIPVPNLQFNLVYVFDHLCRHLRFEGVGIRQFVDLAILISQIKKVSSKDFDLNTLKRDLKGLGLYRAWCVFGAFMVDYLGVSAEEYPLYQKEAKLPDHILNLIIDGGTFDSVLNWRKHTQREDSGLKRMLTALKNDFHVAQMLYPLFPRQAIEGFIERARLSFRKKVFGY